MRIAFLPGIFPVLAEAPVLNQITGLVERGHDVEIFASRPTGSSRYHPSIDRLGLLQRTHYPRPIPSLVRRPSDLSRVLREASEADRVVLRRALNPWRQGGRALLGTLAYQSTAFLPPGAFDIIQAGFGEHGLRALRMVRLGAIQGKLVTAIRGADLTKFVRRRGPRVYRSLFAAGDLFLPVCRSFARRLEGLGCPPEKIVVHGTGIDLRLFQFQARLPGRPLRLLSVGRLVEKKGFDDALRAVAELHRHGVELRYDLVGQGEEREQLETLARKLRIEGSVHFTGGLQQAEVVSLLGSAHALLAPSVTAADGDEEGIPNVLKEAMAAGVPVVSTTHSGIPELVEHGINGLLVPERDSAGLAAAIQHLMDHPEIWGPMTAAARQKVEREYDIEKLNDRLVKLYEDVER